MQYEYNNQPGKTLHERYRAEAVTPLVSIITPFFNAGEHFEQTYRCVCNQTFPYFEWIIMDDASTDADDVALLRRLSATDARIHLHRRDNALREKSGRSFGAPVARNEGAQLATTEYLVFLDADDLIEPTFLECLYLALQQEPTAAWAYTDVVSFGAQELLWRREFSSDLMKTENLLVITAMLRKEAFFSVGGFAPMEGRYYNEDWQMWLHLLAKGCVPVHVAQYLFWYRRANKGVMAEMKSSAEVMAQNRAIIEQAARDVPNGVKAIEYVSTKQESFTGITRWPAPRPLPFAKKKTHLLFILPHILMGGADRFNLEFISRLDREQYDLTIVTTLPEDNDWQQRFSAYADDIFSVPFLFDMREWPAFIDYLMQTREISLVFNTNSYYGYFLLPWLRALYPAVPMVDYVHLEEWYYRGGGYARMTGAVGAALDKTYVCNENTRRVILERFGRAPETVKTVYIGVDEARFDPENASAETVYDVLPTLSREKPVVLFPCRICAQKRPFLMHEIAKQMPAYQFVVVGDGPQEQELRDTVKEQGTGNVFFAGRQNDMRPWYQAAAVTLICSLREGLSLTAYESLAMKTPVVTSDAGGQRELIEAATGVVVPLDYKKTLDEDNRDFADETPLYVQAIERVVTAPDYDAMCVACRQKIENGFTVAQMASALTAELQALLTDEAAAQRAARFAHMPQLLPLFESYAELFADFDYLERRFFFSDGSYRYFKERYETEGQPAAKELARLQQTRSYRVAAGYQRLVNESFLKHVRAFLGGLRRRK